VKSSSFTLALAVVLIGCVVAPVAGQGVTAGFVVYVRFFYPFQVMYNIQVEIQDQTGRVVGTGFSSDGSLLVIPVRTETPIISLSVFASGYASGPLTYYYPTSPSFWLVHGSSTIPVQSTGGEYWITVNLSQ